MNKELMRLKEVSEKTSLSVATLRRLIKREKMINAVKLGGNYYMTQNDYTNLLYYIYFKDLKLSNEEISKFNDYIHNRLSEKESKNQMLCNLYIDTMNEVLNNIKQANKRLEEKYV